MFEKIPKIEYVFGKNLIRKKVRQKNYKRENFRVAPYRHKASM